MENKSISIVIEPKINGGFVAYVNNDKGDQYAFGESPAEALGNLVLENKHISKLYIEERK